MEVDGKGRTSGLNVASMDKANNGSHVMTNSSVIIATVKDKETFMKKREKENRLINYILM